MTLQRSMMFGCQQRNVDQDSQHTAVSCYHTYIVTVNSCQSTCMHAIVQFSSASAYTNIFVVYDIIRYVGSNNMVFEIFKSVVLLE